VLGIVAAGLGLWASTTLALNRADPDASARDSAATDRQTLSAAELKYVSSRLGGRSMARVSRHGVWTVVSEPRPTPEGLAYATLPAPNPPLPNPVPWSEIDTVWVRNHRAGDMAMMGLVVGGVVAALAAGSQEGAGEYADLAKISVTGLGAAAGLATGALIGSAVHTWSVVVPIDPDRLRPHGRSIWKSH